MSIKVQSYVWENSKAEGSALLLLLAIADFSHDDGTGAWPSVKTLAQKCRQTDRNVQFLLRKLEGMGELETAIGEGPHGTNAYRIPFHPENISPLKTSAENLPQISPNPLLEPSVNNNKTVPAITPKQEAWNELRDMLMIVSPMDLERFEQLWEEHPDPRRHKFALEQTKKFANPVSSRYYETIFLRYDPERPKERDKPNGRGAGLNPTPRPTMYAEAWLEMNAHEGESPQQVLDRLKVEGKVDTRGIVNWRDDAKNTRAHATTR